MRALSTRPHYIFVSDDRRFLSAAELMERYGVSHMWLVRRMADSDFPKPIRFGPGKTARRYWLAADVELYERRLATLHESK